MSDESFEDIRRLLVERRPIATANTGVVYSALPPLPAGSILGVPAANPSVPPSCYNRLRGLARQRAPR